MKINNLFDELEKLRERIGARPIEVPVIDVIEGLENGIEVKLEDVKSAGPLLTYQEKYLVILYIMGSNSTTEDLRSGDLRIGTPRFHFTQCRTLNEMREAKRLDRYVVTRSEENKFRVEASDPISNNYPRKYERKLLENIQLFPCRYCLAKLRYNGYAQSLSTQLRDKIVKEFKIKEFIAEYDGLLTQILYLPEVRA
ncbi:MAG: hypothetical protein OXC91_12345, partial [Rhodobacteraceae bacterium]|nr:hypothetical protein [Paracoccaceae bacterium]